MPFTSIENTIIEMPDRFINRNSGITITCTDCEIDDNRKLAKLTSASIINGAQTQGEIKRYFSALEHDDPADFLIRAEIIMDPSSRINCGNRDCEKHSDGGEERVASCRAWLS